MATKKTLFGKTIKSVKFDACDRYDARLQAYIQKYRKLYMEIHMGWYKEDDPEGIEVKKELEALTDAEFHYYVMREKIL